MPSNKIGQLKPGQGARRIQAQREGGWTDQAAKEQYEIGQELEADTNTSRPSRASRWRGAGKKPE